MLFKIDGALEHEATYWNEEYKRCFGTYPNPMIGYGVDTAHVAAIQSAVMRYWVEKMKETIDGQKTQV